LKIFWSKRDEVTGKWRKLHYGELYDPYCLPNFIIRVVKTNKVRLAENVARMGAGDVHTGFLWGDMWKRDHLEDLGVDGKIILKWVLQQWKRGMDWIVLDHNRNMWKALLNAVVILRFS